MGSVLSGIGSAVGSVLGMGGSAAEAAGATSNYQAQNPYSQQVLQDELNKQSQIYGGQQSLAQALQQQMAGQGPNPSQTQFMANQQGNIANAQGLIASQRGLNPALAARMGANAATQGNQQAALGSALLQQQQQLGATANLGNIYGQMQQGNIGEQQLYNQANLGQAGINAKTASENAAVKGQAAGQVGSALGSLGSLGATALLGPAAPVAGIAGKLLGGKAHGGYIDGHANVAGDSPHNDTVPAMLSPGEIVIPRSHAHDPEKAKEFIDHLLKENPKKGGYGDVVAARRKKKAS